MSDEHPASDDKGRPPRRRSRSGPPRVPPPSIPAPVGEARTAQPTTAPMAVGELPTLDGSGVDNADLQIVLERAGSKWDAPTEAPLNVVAQVTERPNSRLPRAHALPRTHGRGRPVPVEAPTADYPTISVPTDETHIQDERTASVPAMPAMQGEAPEAVVRAPAKRIRPLKDTGMHRAMSESASALAQVRPLVQWQPADGLLAATLQHDILTPHANAIATAFLKNVGDHPQAKIFLGSETDRQRMVEIIARHLTGLAREPLSDTWVMARLRVGRVHARVGLPIGIYIASVHAIEGLIVAHMRSAPTRQKAKERKLCELLRRLLTLETSLVSQAHHSAQVDGLNNAMRQQAQSGFVRQYGAQVDPVTLLARPNHLRSQLRAALQQPTNDNRGCAVLAIELVGLEEAAWHRGYAYRDAILSETGARVRATLRGADVAGIESTGRVLTVLTHVREKEVGIVVRRLRAALENTAYAVQGHTFRQRLRVGVAFATPADTAEMLIERAVLDAGDVT